MKRKNAADGFLQDGGQPGDWKKSSAYGKIESTQQGQGDGSSAP